MRYIDYLKLQINLFTLMLSTIIVIYSVICYFGSIKPITMPIEAILQFLVSGFASTTLAWWNGHCK